MEEILENQEPEVQAEPEFEEQQQRYQPRPRWQIVLAWIGVVIMVALTAMYYYNIATGGR